MTGRVGAGEERGAGLWDEVRYPHTSTPSVPFLTPLENRSASVFLGPITADLSLGNGSS